MLLASSKDWRTLLTALENRSDGGYDSINDPSRHGLVFMDEAPDQKRLRQVRIRRDTSANTTEAGRLRPSRACTKQSR